MMKGKRLLATLLIILLIYLQINIFAVAKESKNYFIVNGTGDGNCKSIQEALDNAPQDSTIYVKIGVYNEILNIRTRVKLLGEDKDKTVINPISKENKYAICLGAPGVMISNLNITNGASGLYATAVQVSAPETEISNCIIHDTSIGVAIWTSDNLVENCVFTGCSDEGIALLGSKYSKCDNNKITNCTFYNNCDGIELQYSSNNIISYCKFYENSHIGIDAIASSNDGNTILSCEIYNNTVSGLYLASSSDNKITNCFISNNRDGNVVITKNSYNNDIKNSEPDTTYQEAQKDNSLIKRIFNRISDIKNNIGIFSLIFKEKYKF